MTRPSRWVSSIAVLVLASGVALAADEKREEKKSDGFLTSPEVAAAQDAAKAEQQAIVHPGSTGNTTPKNFGTSCCQILQIPASAFHPVSTAVPAGDSTIGYLYPSTFGGTYDFWAPVQLPSGAHIQYVDLYYNDTNAAQDVRVDLRAFTGADASNPPAGSTLVSVSSQGSAGYGYAAAALDYIVSNNVEYNNTAAQLVLRTFFLTTDGSTSFKSVDIWWKRDVSPAPASATFPDVPTSDFGFQYIEALNASGITGGCGGGNYCPDGNVTRRQMAIFIAKALGLYWPL